MFSQGPHKNTCSSATAGVFEQIADYFRLSKKSYCGKYSFGIEFVEEGGGVGAALASMSGGGGGGGGPQERSTLIPKAYVQQNFGDMERFYLAAIWQENWSLFFGKVGGNIRAV